MGTFSVGSRFSRLRWATAGAVLALAGALVPSPATAGGATITVGFVSSRITVLSDPPLVEADEFESDFTTYAKSVGTDRGNASVDIELIAGTDTLTLSAAATLASDAEASPPPNQRLGNATHRLFLEVTIAGGSTSYRLEGTIDRASSGGNSSCTTAVFIEDFDGNSIDGDREDLCGAAGGESLSLTGELAAGTYIVVIDVETSANSGFFSAEQSSASVVYDLLLVLGGEPECDITGTEGDDTLEGTGGDDVICGLGGNDELDGGAGNDTLVGGTGNDTLTGRDGEDTLLGGPGNDRLGGEDGNDLYLGGPGDDRLLGGGFDGDDTMFGCSGLDTIVGGPGEDIMGDAPPFPDSDTAGGPITAADVGCDQASTDQFEGDTFFGGPDNDTITGGAPRDEIYGGDGGDTIIGGGQRDTIFGCEGGDTIEGSGGNDVIHAGSLIDQEEVADANGLGPTDVDCAPLLPDLFKNTVNGGPGDDEIQGDSGPDKISGGPGSDKMRGGRGGDRLDGGSRRDVLIGQDGRDTILANDGTRDTVNGGPGRDRARTDDKDEVSSIEVSLRVR